MKSNGRSIRFLSSALLMWAMFGLRPILAAVPSSASPQQLSYFRSDRGVADPASDPLPDDLEMPQLLRWRVPLDSGQSSPMMSQGRIFLTTYSPASRELATVALEAETGQIAWKRLVPNSTIENFHPTTGNAAVATVACDEKRVYVFFGSHGMLCYDFDGRLVWDHPLGPFQDEYGAGSSPILFDNKIILSQDHDRDSFLLALDASSGKEVWKVDRPNAVRSYSTPTLWSHNGKTELLLAGALELTSYDPGTGAKLWWIDGLARIVIPIPVASGEFVYMASWAPGGDSAARLLLVNWPEALDKWDKNKDSRLARDEIADAQVLDRFYRMDLDQDGALTRQEWDRHAEVFRLAQNAILALKPTGRGQLSPEAVLWKYHRGVPYVSTPLLDQGVLWMVKDGGIVTKLEAATGRVLQEERLPGVGSYYASPVSGDAKVYFASERGVVTVVANRPEWHIISSRSFNEKIYATPLIHFGRLYLRTDQALYCFQRKRSKG